MKFLRVVLGFAIGAVGFVAALVVLMVFFLFFPGDDTLAERLGAVVILALVEGVIFVGSFYAFRKVMGPRPRDQNGEAAKEQGRRF